MNQEDRVDLAIQSMQLSRMTAGWLMAGVALGYPTCCIKSFMKLSHFGETEERKLSGTGFVPCAFCNETKTVEQLVDEINRARSPLIPPFTSVVEEHQRHA